SGGHVGRNLRHYYAGRRPGGPDSDRGARARRHFPERHCRLPGAGARGARRQRYLVMNKNIRWKVVAIVAVLVIFAAVGVYPIIASQYGITSPSWLMAKQL